MAPCSNNFTLLKSLILSLALSCCTCSRVVVHKDALPAPVHAKVQRLQAGKAPPIQAGNTSLTQDLEEPPGLQVPKALHQSWKSDEVPAKYKPWVESWKQLHPGWTHVLWTDDMNRYLVEKHYDWFMPIYDAFPREIMRADSARYLYMHKYGGMYADLDFLALKSVDALLTNVSVAVGKIAHDDWEHNFPNAWLASVPGHPFWLYVITEIIRAYQRNPKGQVEAITGPVMLHAAISSYQKHAGAVKWRPLTFIPPGVLYPIDWRKGPPVCNPRTSEYNFSRCLAKYPDAYAITFWLHSWH